MSYNDAINIRKLVWAGQVTLQKMEIIQAGSMNVAKASDCDPTVTWSLGSKVQILEEASSKQSIWIGIHNFALKFGPSFNLKIVNVNQGRSDHFMLKLVPKISH